jgi:2-C-methyl-D-erythritol 4-phosphate cytidylyltransferase
VWTIVVAAGAGSRFGGPKQYESLGDRRVVDWSIAAAAAASDGVVVVEPPERATPGGAAVGGAVGRSVAAGSVAGGPTRSASVRCGLAQVPADATIVCVHDAARPFASATLFQRVVEAVRGGADGAVPGLPLADTVKEVDAAGWVVGTPDRSKLVAVQTPQAFRAGALRRAHAGAADGTDDSALVEAIGGRVLVVEGEAANRKLTLPEDLVWARRVVEEGRVVEGSLVRERGAT